MPIVTRAETAFRGAGEDLSAAVKGFIAQARASAADGLTFVEFGTLAFALVQLSMLMVDRYRDTPGADRKAWVLSAAAALFDALLPLLPLPARIPGVSSILRSVFLAIVSGAIESLLPTVRAAACSRRSR